MKQNNIQTVEYVTKKHNEKSFPIKQILVFVCCSSSLYLSFKCFLEKNEIFIWLLIQRLFWDGKLAESALRLLKFHCWLKLSCKGRFRVKEQTAPSWCISFQDLTLNSLWILTYIKEFHNEDLLKWNGWKWMLAAHKRCQNALGFWQNKQPVCQQYHFDIKINKFTTTCRFMTWRRWVWGAEELVS